jgi:hypothetical protein
LRKEGSVALLGSLITEFVSLLEEFEFLGEGVVWQVQKGVLEGCEAAGDVVRVVHGETVSHLIVEPERTNARAVGGRSGNTMSALQSPIEESEWQANLSFLWV